MVFKKKACERDNETYDANYKLSNKVLKSPTYYKLKGILQLKNNVALKCPEYPSKYYKYILRSV